MQVFKPNRLSAVYNAVRGLAAENKTPCTLGEVATITGFSPTMILRHVRLLAAHGILSYTPGLARTIALGERPLDEAALKALCAPRPLGWQTYTRARHGRWLLLNSSMMPQEGMYRCYRLSEKDFSDLVIANRAQIESYIGYPATADHIANLTGVRPPLNREKTVVRHGDRMLICRLEYRVNDPSQKRNLTPAPEDFEYFFAVYFRPKKAEQSGYG